MRLSRLAKAMSLKETLLEPVQNASRSIVVIVYRLFRANHRSEVDRETITVLREDHDAWENLSAEALENFEKRFD